MASEIRKFNMPSIRVPRGWVAPPRGRADGDPGRRHRASKRAWRPVGSCC
jgi:hypothetical protein